MHKIIGGDKKEYGPASAEEIRQWIAEGRLSSMSQVQAEGSGEWKALGSVAEFADALRQQAVHPLPALAPAPPVSGEAWVSQVLAARPEVEPGRCLAQSWKLLIGNFGTLVGATLLIWLIGTACELNLISSLVYQVLWGEFYGGLYVVFLGKIRVEAAPALDSFPGVNHGFGERLVAG